MTAEEREDKRKGLPRLNIKIKSVVDAVKDGKINDFFVGKTAFCYVIAIIFLVIALITSFIFLIYGCCCHKSQGYRSFFCTKFFVFSSIMLGLGVIIILIIFFFFTGGMISSVNEGGCGVATLYNEIVHGVKTDDYEFFCLSNLVSFLSDFSSSLNSFSTLNSSFSSISNKNLPSLGTQAIDSITTFLNKY